MRNSVELLRIFYVIGNFLLSFCSQKKRNTPNTFPSISQ